MDHSPLGLHLNQLAPCNQLPHQESLDLLSIAMEERKYSTALEIVSELILMDTQKASLYLARASILFELEKYQQALHNCLFASKCKEQGDQNHELQICSLAMKCLIECPSADSEQLSNEFFLENPRIASLLALGERMRKVQDIQRCQLSLREEKILKQMKWWLYQAGAQYDKLRVVTVGNKYRGVVAVRSIKKKEWIVSIPRSHIITLQLARRNDFCRELALNKLELASPKHSCIAIYLLEEMRKEDSPWKLYLDILPKDHRAFPINYTVEELQELAGSAFLEQIKEKVYDLKRDYDYVTQSCPTFCKYSFREFCWARMIVGSRIFGLKIDGIKTEILVPFADMLNHKLPKQTMWSFDQEKNCFFIESLEDISPGDEVFDSYGKKCNSRFLLNYGFVLAENLANEVCFKEDLLPQDPTLLRKVEMLKGQPAGKVFKITAQLYENRFFEFMGFLRFRSITSSDTLTVLETISNIKGTTESYNPLRTPPISLQLEMTVWKDLLLLCETALKGYPNSIEEDEQLLSETNISENIRNIIILRHGEKAIFRKYVQIALKVIDALGKGYQCALEQVQHNSQPWASYVEKILNLMPSSKGKNSPQPMEMLERKESLIEQGCEQN